MGTKETRSLEHIKIHAKAQPFLPRVVFLMQYLAPYAYMRFSFYSIISNSRVQKHSISLQADLAFNNVATFKHVHRQTQPSSFISYPKSLQTPLKQCSINTLTKPPRGTRNIRTLPRYTSASPKMRQTEQNGRTCFLARV